MIRIAIIYAFLGLVLLTAPLAGAGAAASDLRTRIVRYDDLALATPSGQARLHRRIVLASRAVCEVVDSHDVAATFASDACQRAALAAADARLAAVTAQAIARQEVAER